MQRALVTGGARGIGEAIVRRLAAGGFAVTAIDLDENALGQLARDLPIEPIKLDLTDHYAVSDALAGRPPFSVVVNNAGIDQHAWFTNTTPTDWTRLLAINLQAVLSVTLATLPAMREARYGRFVNVASEAGRQGSRGGAVYAAAKGGVIAFTRSIARENADRGVTANIVAPGPIDTPLLRDAVETVGNGLLGAMERATLLGRLGTPDEVASAVAFLGSREAGYITGEVLGVSGGMGCGT